VIRSRFTSLGTVLIGVLCSVGWYALVFRALGQNLTLIQPVLTGRPR